MDLAAFLAFLAELSDAMSAEDRTAAISAHLAELTAGMDAPAALEALAALSAEVLAATDAQMDSDARSPQALANLTAFAEISSAVTDAQAYIEAEDANALAQAQALADQIRGPVADGGDGDENETPAEDDENGDGGVTPAEDDEETPAEGATEAQPVAAGGTPARVEPSRALRPAARRPAAVMPVTAGATGGVLPDDIEQWGLVAGANMPGAGNPIRNNHQLAEAFESAVQASAGFVGPGGKVKLATIGGEPGAVGFTEDRILDGNHRRNFAKIQAVTDRRVIEERVRQNGGVGSPALAAAGGPCAAPEIRYDQPMLGEDDRPVRDALTRFGADRAGVRLYPPVLFEDMAGATGFWTVANDINPGSDGPAVKPCLTMTCPADEDYFVYAITQCLEIGNFRARFFGEQVEAWIRQAAVMNARLADVRLLEAIGTASTQVTSGTVLGTLPDILATLDRAIAIIRSSNRLGRDFPLRWIAPFWMLDQVRTDLARRLPFGTTDENYALAESKFASWLAQRNVTVTLALDGESGQMFNRQGDGPMQGWPSAMVTYLYPEGSHLLLDAGELNLGIIRDSALIETNDYRMFSEVFEGHAFHGVESWKLTIDTCPDGSVSAAIDINPCATGS